MLAWCLPTIGLLLLMTSTGGKAQQSMVRDVLSIYQDLDVMCRSGAGDKASKNEACEVRRKIDKLLGQLGYCYGKQSDLGSDGRGPARAVWRKCTPESVEMP